MVKRVNFDELPFLAVEIHKVVVFKCPMNYWVMQSILLLGRGNPDSGRVEPYYYLAVVSVISVLRRTLANTAL